MESIIEEHQEECLALALHETLCHWNHVDGCGWQYENDWTKWAHERYAKKAKELLKICDFETLMKIVPLLKG